jgi:diphthamide biosynthesis methyltransferase
MRDDLFLEEYTQKLLDAVRATIRSVPPKNHIPLASSSVENFHREIIKEINKLEDEAITIIKESKRHLNPPLPPL